MIRENKSQLSITDGKAHNVSADEKQDDAHDIKTHIEKIHNIKKQLDDPQAKRMESFRKLRKLIKK
jgi:hypothetical protein